MAQRTKAVWITVSTRDLILRRAGELQAKTGQRVTFEDAILAALRLLDVEAAARLILNEDAGFGGGKRNGAADPLPRESGLPPVR